MTVHPSLEANVAAIQSADRSAETACARCNRLTAYRTAIATKHPDWHNLPVLPTGPVHAPILIVGLAPGLKGANRTGLPFVGDDASKLLMDCLAIAGTRPNGTVSQQNTRGPVAFRITNAVRCVPPHNKPTAAEISTCRPYLASTIATMAQLKVIVALGRVAHDSVVRTLGSTAAKQPFTHGAAHCFSGGLVLIDSYHCSRYNVSTGRLTPQMLQDVMDRAFAIANGTVA